MDRFNFRQIKFLKIKPFEIFKRPKFLLYSKTALLIISWNKPDVVRKGLEMAGIVKAVIKHLEPEDSFKILVVDY